MTEIKRKIISEVNKERADSDDGTSEFFDFNENFDQLTANKSTTQRANIEVLY